MNDYNFGNFVCILREKQGLTQADLARQLNVTSAAISKWENGSSKPRVEVLFQLAEILGVTPEELMAGHYIEKEHLDPESVAIINEKYEYLRKIELHNTSKTKVLRLIAGLLDWYISGFTTLLALSVSIACFDIRNTSISGSRVWIILLLMMIFPVSFVLRDFLFGGRSLGKRIMGLTVLNKQTANAPKKGALVLRNIFLFFISIELIIMLTTGLTLGDRAAHTVVVRKKDIFTPRKGESPEQRLETINRYTSEQKTRVQSNKKQAIMWTCIIVAVFLLFVGSLLTVIKSSMSERKETEEYKLAYAYVIESQKFHDLGIDEEQLTFNSYSFQTQANGIKDVEIGFQIDFFHNIIVILHDEGNGWYVCKECTEFE